MQEGPFLSSQFCPCLERTEIERTVLGMTRRLSGSVFLSAVWLLLFQVVQVPLQIWAPHEKPTYLGRGEGHKALATAALSLSIVWSAYPTTRNYYLQKNLKLLFLRGMSRAIP